MTAGHRYSTAPRCAVCGGRALLTGDTAQALAAGSSGRLGLVECPAGDGWHVWEPGIERVYVRTC